MRTRNSAAKTVTLEALATAEIKVSNLYWKPFAQQWAGHCVRAPHAATCLKGVRTVLPHIVLTMNLSTVECGLCCCHIARGGPKCTFVPPTASRGKKYKGFVKKGFGIKRFQNLYFRRTLTDLLEWSHNVQPFGTEDGHLAGNATGALNCRPHKWEDQPQAPRTDQQLSCASTIQTAWAAESA